MDFNFVIDKNYLLLKMLGNNGNIEELTVWKNNVVVDILGIKVIEEIEKRKENIEEYFSSGEFQQFVLNNNLKLKLNKIMEDELFNKYYNENIEYLNLVQKGWLSVKNKINNWFKKTIRMNIPERLIRVYVSHPKLNTGKCVDKR